MLKKLYKLSVSTVQVMPLFPFLIWFSNSLPFAFFPFFFHQRSKHVMKSNCLYHLYLAYSHDFPMNFSSFYSWHLQGEGVKLPAFDPRHLSTSTTAGCDMSRCFERARARPGLAVMQRGKRPDICDIWVKIAARAPSMGNMGRLHPEQSTKHGLNYVQRSHNDHYIQIWFRLRLLCTTARNFAKDAAFCLPSSEVKRQM